MKRTVRQNMFRLKRICLKILLQKKMWLQMPVRKKAGKKDQTL